MERKSEGERDEMKLEMLLLLLCAKRQTDADARNFYGFNPPEARRASEGGKKENAYGSINAFIWPPSLRSVPYSFSQKRLEKTFRRPSNFASKITLLILPRSDGSLRNG